MFQIQKPAVQRALTPLYAHDFRKPWSLDQAIRTTITAPILESGMMEDNEEISEEKLKNMISYLCAHSSGCEEEHEIKEMLSLVLDHFDRDTKCGFDQVFAIQSLARTGLPCPDRSIIYTIEDDLIPACESFYRNGSGYDELLCATAFALRPPGLVLYCKNRQSFQAFQKWMSISLGLEKRKPEWMSEKVEKRIEQFLNLDLEKLTLSFWIRARLDQSNEPYSFARILTSAILGYSAKCDSKEFGVLPCSYRGLLCPQTVTFMNLQIHTLANAESIYSRWRCVKAESVRQPAVLDSEAVEQLDSADEAIESLEKTAQDNIQKIQNPDAFKRSSKFGSFDGKPKDYKQILTRILKRMSRVSRSQNIIKKEVRTFARASRRFPDDCNRKGIRKRNEYLPDIHLYVDTSGSISFEDYCSSVLTCIQIAKAFNVDIYFNSFSTVLSEEFRFDTKKSFQALKRDFENITPVTGGTSFDIVWKYILSSPKRKKELSIMITDFGYTARNISDEHPENLYYIPCHTGNNVEGYIAMWAEEFAQSMLPICPRIDSKILM